MVGVSLPNSHPALVGLVAQVRVDLREFGDQSMSELPDLISALRLMRPRIPNQLILVLVWRRGPAKNCFHRF
jgi:hypothetical protein